jgi:hypothetical protein
MTRKPAHTLTHWTLDCPICVLPKRQTKVLNSY